MGNMKKGNYIISIVMLLIGVGIVCMSSQFKIAFGKGDPGAGFWPGLLGIILIGLSIGLFLGTLKNRQKLEEKTYAVSQPANRRVYITMAAIVGFCLVLYFLGFYIAAVLFIPAVMYILEVRSPKRIMITTAATVIAIYVIFGMLLKIALPAPIFMG